MSGGTFPYCTALALFAGQAGLVAGSMTIVCHPPGERATLSLESFPSPPQPEPVGLVLLATASEGAEGLGLGLAYDVVTPLLNFFIGREAVIAVGRCERFASGVPQVLWCVAIAFSGPGSPRDVGGIDSVIDQMAPFLGTRFLKYGDEVLCKPLGSDDVDALEQSVRDFMSEDGAPVWQGDLSAVWTELRRACTETVPVQSRDDAEAECFARQLWVSLPCSG